MKMNAVDIRVGNILDINGQLFRVHWSHHSSAGNWRSSMQTKLKNLKTGFIIEQRFRVDEKVEKVILDDKDMEWLYKDDSGFHFMDAKTYEQISLSEEVVGEASKFLIAGCKAGVTFYEGRALGVTLPSTVDLKVVETQPGLKRASATSSPKPAILETGLTVQVPQFVEVGDTVRVNTDTGQYQERV